MQDPGESAVGVAELQEGAEPGADAVIPTRWLPCHLSPAVFCFLLVLADGEPNESAAFVSAIPNWSVGEVITLGLGERLRILGIEVGVHDELFRRGVSGVFTVAPVG